METLTFIGVDKLRADCSAAAAVTADSGLIEGELEFTGGGGDE